MKKHKYLKLYKPRFVRHDPTKDHIRRIIEATRNYMTISIPKMCEAVIRTDKYAKLLENELIQSSKSIEKNLTILQLLKKLNNVFEIYLIKFSFNAEDPKEKEEFCGISRMSLDGKTKIIVVYCNNNFDINFYKQDKTLFQTFFELIAHELSHRGQILLRSYKASLEIYNRDIKKDSKILSNINLDADEKERLLMREHLSRSEEIMAYANQILEELRFQGLNSKQIIEKLKSLKIDSGLSSGMDMYNKYFSISNKDDLVVIKRLFRYIYEYITGKEKHVFGVDLF